MKILIVRHADPDYSLDSLTTKGWKEAEYLSEKLKNIPAKAYYCSTMGRAKDTASLTLKKVNKTAEYHDWLREFKPSVHRLQAPYDGGNAWDWCPQDWMTYRDFFDKDKWYLHPNFKEVHVKEEYDKVIREFDKILLNHGYKRDEAYYKVLEANNDTIVFFTHFGLECVLLSHLCNLSPMILWHNFCAAPSSVTTVVSEERREGIASFRVTSFGDVSHLYKNDESPSFAARFCECFTNENERHN